MSKKVFASCQQQAWITLIGLKCQRRRLKIQSRLNHKQLVIGSLSKEIFKKFSTTFKDKIRRKDAPKSKEFFLWKCLSSDLWAPRFSFLLRWTILYCFIHGRARWKKKLKFPHTILRTDTFLASFKVSKREKRNSPATPTFFQHHAKLTRF